ncbi:tail fiber domain-containing protein [Dyadobacter sp. 50-39]|uniref:tail fiber domain-containing protein n=1 Tax=Dyadobacter sp. 50-39 TaxID=1895756 RepID=UPI000A455088|nr:tail fiber domain-containing protein [Dyadobacter sp. 50-39]
MQRGILVLFLICLASILVPAHAQAPYKFTFQGQALDDNLQPIQNGSVTVRISIIQTQPLGPQVFEEVHSTNTNLNGFFTVTVGSAGGDLSQIPWPYDVFFLKAEVDDQNNGKFHFIGMTQLLSVPYSLYANESGKWRDQEPIVQKGELLVGQTLPPVGAGARMIWYPRKAAFRVGSNFNKWEDQEMGKFTFASGLDTQAFGDYSSAFGDRSSSMGKYSISGGFLNVANGKAAIALGFSNNADKDHSIALGHTSQALNPFSVAIGSGAAAMADHAVALGHHTVAKASFGLAVGLYNNSFDQPNGGLTDRLFQIGNGTDLNNRTNAMTVLRNGNIGIGGKATIPEFILDVASRMRIRNDGSTAGLYLNNSQNKPEGFMGMKTDKQIGFYLNGAWRFWIDENGNASTQYGVLQIFSSDKRLKRDINPLKGSLDAISQVHGYHYHWIDANRGTDLQTGVLAQEVEKYFPELVQANDKGFKTVNYIGLIPHLIESVKELKNQTAEIAELRKEIRQLKLSVGTDMNAAPRNTAKTK